MTSRIDTPDSTRPSDRTEGAPGSISTPMPQEAGYRVLIEKLPHAVILTNNDFQIVYLNKQATEMLGLSDPAQATGRGFLDFLDGDGRQRLTAFAAESDLGPIRQKYQQKEMSSGRPAPILSLTRLLNKDGGPKGFLIAADPATEIELVAPVDEHAELKAALLGTATAISSTIKLKDPFLADHQERVTRLACAIAEEMGLPEAVIESLDVAGNVHDVGKLIVPNHVLSKPGKLTDEEFRVIQNHVQTVHDVIQGIVFPWPVVQAVYQHHERLDASGYPHGLRGEEIILEARILAVADVVEAMASRRPYRAGLGVDRALEEVTQRSASMFDPDVAEACRVLFKEKRFNFL